MSSKTPAVSVNDEGENDLSPAHRNVILFAVVLTATLYATTILIVSTILPQLQGAMAATADEITWTMTFNILATAVATPTAGWLVSRLGKRGVMMWSVAGFAISTYLCGTATSLEELIFWRIVQGAVGAPMTPITQTILLDTFPKRLHGPAIGMFGAGVMMGAFLGPVIGGVMVEILDWRWAFFIIAPVGGLAFVLLSLTLPHDEPAKNVPLDWTGFILLSFSIATMQLVLSRGQNLDWFESTEILLEAFIALLTGYLFIVHSLTSDKPFINLRWFLNRNYTLGVILVFIYGMLNFTPMVVLPALLRNQIGYPESLIGYVLGSRGFGAMAGFLLAMFIAQKYPVQSMFTGFVGLVIAGYWLTTFNLNVTFMELALNGILQGFAVGIVWVPMTIVTFSTLPPSARAETSAVFHLMRNLGSSFFISLTVTEIVRSTSINYAYLTELVTPYSQVFNMPWIIGGWSTETVGSLTGLSKEMKRQAAMIGYLNAFGVFTLVSAAAVPLILLMRNPYKK